MIRRGTYILIMALGSDREIPVGALGPILFPAGTYCYVGSAMGGLDQRVSRHLSRDKRVRWHIDRLTLAADEVTAYESYPDFVPECILASMAEGCGMESLGLEAPSPDARAVATFLVAADRAVAFLTAALRSCLGSLGCLGCLGCFGSFASLRLVGLRGVGRFLLVSATRYPPKPRNLTSQERSTPWRSSTASWTREMRPSTSAAEARERSTSGGTGKMNAAEACATIDTLKSYISKIGSSRIAESNIDFAIISPYKSQVQLLRRLIKSDPGLRRIRHAITTDTVDGFQGQERDVVIISLVRSNDRGDIGFLTDLRRMNVAMTRARMKLIIVGDVTTLSRHTFFAALHDYVTSLNRDCN